MDVPFLHLKLYSAPCHGRKLSNGFVCVRVCALFFCLGGRRRGALVNERSVYASSNSRS